MDNDQDGWLFRYVLRPIGLMLRVANDPLWGGTLPRNRPQRQHTTASPSGIMLTGV